MKRIVILLLCIAGSAWAQTDINVVGIGARAAGMGYAFTALADDATGINWNPAGLSQLFQPEISAGGLTNYRVYSYKWDKSRLDENGYRLADFTVSENPKFNPNFLCLVWPFSANIGTESIHFAPAISYRSLYAMNRKWVNKTTWENTTGYELDRKRTWDQSGGVYAISPALGVQLMPQLAMGLTFNTLSGSYRSDFENEENGQVVGTSFYEERGYSGSNLEFGLLGNPIPNSNVLSVGLKYSFAYDVSYDVNDNDDTTYGYSEQFPAYLALGIALRPNDRFTISFDNHRQNWSKIDSSYRDVSSYHLGLEFINADDVSTGAYRIGYYSTPYREKDEAGNPISGSALTFGMGSATSVRSFDIALQYETLEWVNEYLNGKRIDASRTGWSLMVNYILYIRTSH
jgi:hypothetical protein